MNGDRILRRKEVEALIGLSRSTIYSSMSRGEFPRPLKLGRRAVGWQKSDLDAWLTRRDHSSGWPK